jgi:DNA-binding NtrC family response regulator
MGTILVIDDSASMLVTVAAILAEAGHEVLTCGSGKQAVPMLSGQALDLVITDIYMPDEDGLEIIRDTRRICPEVPVIAMSGMTGKWAMLKVAAHLGASGTLVKPFSPGQLLQVVEKALATAPPPYV